MTTRRGEPYEEWEHTFTQAVLQADAERIDKAIMDEDSGDTANPYVNTGATLWFSGEPYQVRARPENTDVYEGSYELACTSVVTPRGWFSRLFWRFIRYKAEVRRL